jgi:REP element-mobilizing transposase RayT
MILRNRQYLPHWELPKATYFITFRLSGTLPQKVLKQIRYEREMYQESVKRQSGPLSYEEQTRLKYLESSAIQKYLDKGLGECWLQISDVAEVLVNAIAYFDGSRYRSHALGIMPNHFHWLMTPAFQQNTSSINSSLISILHSIKSFSAHQANKILKRTGPFWSREYDDHLVRDSEQFGKLLAYILENPIKAGLCRHWEEWRWTKCSQEIYASLRSS